MQAAAAKIRAIVSEVEVGAVYRRAPTYKSPRNGVNAAWCCPCHAVIRIRRRNAWA